MKVTFLVFTLILSLGLNGQTQERKFGRGLSEVRKHKNQLDLDVKSVFSSLTNATLMYKRAYQKGKLIDANAIRSIRLLGRFNNQLSFTKDPTREDNDTSNVGFHPSNIVDTQMGIGFEIQKMNKYFVHYYGIDGIFHFFKMDEDVPNATFGGVINNATSTTDRLLRTMSAGFIPFFGVKYYFTSRISVGVETGFSIVYFNQSITEVNMYQRAVDGRIESIFVKDAPVKSHGMQFNFNNLRFLTVGYTF